MQKKSEEKDFFDSIVVSNEGITRKNVRDLFIWYDLLGYALPFQLIFICIYLAGIRSYPITMVSIIFVLIVDSILKNSLEKDGKNYQKFSKHIALVKLWTIPLLVMGTFATVAVLVAAFRVV